MKKRTIKNKLFNYVVSGDNTLTLEDKELIKLEYFRICKKIPNDKLISLIEYYGGIDKVLKNVKLQKTLASIFKAEITDIYVRIIDLYTNKENLVIKEKTLEKK